LFSFINPFEISGTFLTGFENENSYEKDGLIHTGSLPAAHD
jgi:hypothetical protein